MNKKYSYTDKELIRTVKRSVSYSEILSDLGLVPAGGNYETIKRKIHILGLDISHFQTHPWNKGKKVGPKRPVQNYLRRYKLDEVPSRTGWLKERLIEEDLLKHICQKCERTQWNGLIIPLELDHIDGDRRNNTIENLRVLCPNCHAQTSTYRGKNIGRGDGIGLQSALKKRCLKGHAGSNPVLGTTCINCNKQIGKASLRCKSCTGKYLRPKKIEWPTISRLQKMVTEFGYSKTGRELGVSDNAVRKHLKVYSKQ